MKRSYHRVGFTAEQTAELWERWKRGEGLKAIGRVIGKPSSCVFAHLKPSGGIRPPPRRRSRLALTLADMAPIATALRDFGYAAASRYKTVFALVFFGMAYLVMARATFSIQTLLVAATLSFVMAVATTFLLPASIFVITAYLEARKAGTSFKEYVGSDSYRQHLRRNLW